MRFSIFCGRTKTGTTEAADYEFSGIPVRL